VKGTLSKMDPTGHTEVKWDTDESTREADELSQDEVDRRFNEMIEDGALAFVVDPKTKKGEQITPSEFDPEVHSNVIVSPAFQGG
jgi:hypothetical protein